MRIRHAATNAAPGRSKHTMRTCLKLVLPLIAALMLAPMVGAAQSGDEGVEILASGEVSTWSFSPNNLSVTAGTTLTWRNTGAQAHSVTSRDQLFDSRLLDPGESWSYTFETPGVYRYFCVPHPLMKGAIIVSPSDEPTPRPTATP